MHKCHTYGLQSFILTSKPSPDVLVNMAGGARHPLKVGQTYHLVPGHQQKLVKSHNDPGDIWIVSYTARPTSILPSNTTYTYKWVSFQKSAKISKLNLVRPENMSSMWPVQYQTTICTGKRNTQEQMIFGSKFKFSFRKMHEAVITSSAKFQKFCTAANELQSNWFWYLMYSSTMVSSTFKTCGSGHGTCGCLVTWFCYQLIAKPGNKTATVPWPDPYVKMLENSAVLAEVYFSTSHCQLKMQRCLSEIWHHWLRHWLLIWFILVPHTIRLYYLWVNKIYLFHNIFPKYWISDNTLHVCKRSDIPRKSSFRSSNPSKRKTLFLCSAPADRTSVRAPWYPYAPLGTFQHSD